MHKIVGTVMTDTKQSIDASVMLLTSPGMMLARLCLDEVMLISNMRVIKLNCKLTAKKKDK